MWVKCFWVLLFLLFAGVVVELGECAGLEFIHYVPILCARHFVEPVKNQARALVSPWAVPGPAEPGDQKSVGCRSAKHEIFSQKILWLQCGTEVGLIQGSRLVGGGLGGRRGSLEVQAGWAGWQG